MPRSLPPNDNAEKLELKSIFLKIQLNTSRSTNFSKNRRALVDFAQRPNVVYL